LDILLGNQSKEIEMRIAKLVTAIVLSAGLGFAAQAQEETPVEMKDLPSEARTTIKEKTERSDSSDREGDSKRQGMLRRGCESKPERNGDPGRRQWQVYRHSSRERSAKGKGREILIAARGVEQLPAAEPIRPG
jgi:hypothetical protein